MARGIKGLLEQHLASWHLSNNQNQPETIQNRLSLMLRALGCHFTKARKQVIPPLSTGCHNDLGATEETAHPANPGVLEKLHTEVEWPQRGDSGTEFQLRFRDSYQDCHGKLAEHLMYVRDFIDLNGWVPMSYFKRYQ
ncbi:hypothetical protein FRB99_003600, partial [Tulasnella sp. 403]